MTIQKPYRLSRPVRRAGLVILVAMATGSAGCEGDGESDAAFPVFRDADANGVNDFVEAGAHLVSVEDPRWHEYIDANSDGICDFWDADSPRHLSGRRDQVHGTDFAEVPHTGGDPRHTMMGR